MHVSPDMNPHNAMDQAVSTAALYLGGAVEHIDRMFCDGYAEKNPALVAAFMQVAAKDYGDLLDAWCRQHGQK